MESRYQVIYFEMMSIALQFGIFYFFHLVTQNRTLMLEITHTYTPQTTTYTIRMEQPLYINDGFDIKL